MPFVMEAECEMRIAMLVLVWAIVVIVCEAIQEKSSLPSLSWLARYHYRFSDSSTHFHVAPV
jgi:hypothetical protein